VSQSRQSSATSAVGGTGIGGGIGYAPGVLRAYASSSLQLRVAELHQELGPRGGGGGGGGGTMPPPTASTRHRAVQAQSGRGGRGRARATGLRGCPRLRRCRT
jgi:hypothetical protein